MQTSAAEAGQVRAVRLEPAGPRALPEPRRRYPGGASRSGRAARSRGRRGGARRGGSAPGERGAAGSPAPGRVRGPKPALAEGGARGGAEPAGGNRAWGGPGAAHIRGNSAGCGRAGQAAPFPLMRV